MAEDIRPPYVSFETRAVEDRNASIEAGHFVTKDIDFISIVPHGSEGRTVIEQEYVEWLKKIRPLAGQDYRASGAGSDTPLMGEARFPMAWLTAIENGYKHWKEGKEIPVEGTSLLNWPVMSPAMAKNCIALHIRTVEELADASDEAISRIGLSGVTLQHRAKDWVTAKRDGGGAKLGAELENLRAQNDAKETRINSLEERLRKFEAATIKVPA